MEICRKIAIDARGTMCFSINQLIVQCEFCILIDNGITFLFWGNCHIKVEVECPLKIECERTAKLDITFVPHCIKSACREALKFMLNLHIYDVREAASSFLIYPHSAQGNKTLLFSSNNFFQIQKCRRNFAWKIVEFLLKRISNQLKCAQHNGMIY